LPFDAPLGSARGRKVGDTSCEACHGPGSLHVQSGGKAGTDHHPHKSP